MRGFFRPSPIIIIRLNKKLGLHVVIGDFRKVEGLAVCEMKDRLDAESGIVLFEAEVRRFGFIQFAYL